MCVCMRVCVCVCEVCMRCLAAVCVYAYVCTRACVCVSESVCLSVCWKPGLVSQWEADWKRVGHNPESPAQQLPQLKVLVLKPGISLKSKNIRQNTICASLQHNVIVDIQDTPVFIKYRNIRQRQPYKREKTRTQAVTDIRSC